MENYSKMQNKNNIKRFKKLMTNSLQLFNNLISYFPVNQLKDKSNLKSNLSNKNYQVI